MKPRADTGLAGGDPGGKNISKLTLSWMLTCWALLQVFVSGHAAALSSTARGQAVQSLYEGASERTFAQRAALLMRAHIRPYQHERARRQ